MTEPVQIRPASPQRQAQVLTLVFRHLSPDARAARITALLDGARSRTLSLNGLLEAQRGSRLVGGVLVDIQPGRTATVWPPRVVTHEPVATQEHLLARVWELLAKERICIAYSLLEPGMEEDGRALRAAAFEPLAVLLYLASEHVHFPCLRPAGPLEFEPYSSADHARLARLVEATYERTQDCPRLNGLRQVDDVLAGHRATGVFDPARWLIVRHQRQDVGCLLLADHPQQQSWELVYMGLVPSARGKAWGTDVTRHAQWMTGQAGRVRLVLAVDAANAPAIRTYSTLGFQTWERRHVYFKVLDAPTAPADRRSPPGTLRT